MIANRDAVLAEEDAKQTIEISLDLREERRHVGGAKRNAGRADDFTAILLDLGRVADIAKVTINNIDVGTVWTSNKLEITKTLHPGVNTLKITVANTWANRLHHTGLPAGLLGPLMLSVHASPSP